VKPTPTENSRNIFVEDCSAFIDGTRWHYLHAGSGPALLLIHGLLGHSFSWRQVLPDLARETSVYAVDLPGSGFSDPPADGDVSLSASAHRLLSFMDQLHLSQCDIVGSSYGGAVAIAFAAFAPQRVQRLVLAAPVNPWSLHGKWLAPVLCNRLVAPLFLRVAPHLTLLHEFYFRRLFGDTRRVPKGALEGYMEPLLQRQGLRHVLHLLQHWDRDLERLRVLVPRLADIPILLIWGERDGAVSPASAEILKRHLNRSRLAVLEGVGHLPYEEAPREFSRTVTEFLKGLSGPIRNA
jgi:pimeloyl-ACP methyl ester carboxylesterase